MDRIDIRKLWFDHQDDFLKLLSIPSVYDPATVDETHPYGKPVDDALAFMKDRCLKAGFTVHDCDHTAIFASLGKGERIDVASHLDVVAPGEGWDHDPFDPVIIDQKIIARGSQDMKSGAWCSFLALKAIKDMNIPVNKELRLVFGTDEERTMMDMRHYIAKEGLPSFAYSPDGRFPMTTGEKGALMWILNKSYSGNVHMFRGGVQPNVISPQASCTVEGSIEEVKKLIQELPIQTAVSSRDNLVEIEVFGKGAHASRPEDGHNATVDLLQLLSLYTNESEWKDLYAFFASPYGNTALARDIEPMGKLTLNLGTLELKDGQLQAMVDCRYPYGVTSKELTQIVSEHLNDWNTELPYDDAPTLVDDQNAYVKAMKAAYREVTGEECESLISGGVSYSKVFGNCVCFGPVGAHSISTAHQKNEAIEIEDCISALDIYLKALLNILEVE